MALTDSANTDRLIRLLMMLPAPDREEHSIFWEKVAEEHQVGLGYVTGKIAVHLEHILLSDESGKGRKGLATYALFFFGHASPELIGYIASSLDMGAPNDSSGEVWVQNLRECAFAVIEEDTTEERVREASAAWIRAHHPRLSRKGQR